MISTFAISVSVQCYKDKNSIPWNTIRYRHAELTIEEFCELIKKGYCFCHCFHTEEEQFGVREKKDVNFVSANMIFIDIDNAEIEMNTFVNKLSVQPTVCYTTANNHTEKSNYKYRFRLCYLFKEPVTNVNLYKSLYKGIMSNLTKEVEGFTNEDNCGQSPSQQFGGNGNENCEVCVSMNEFAFSDFILWNSNIPSSPSISDVKKVKTKPYVDGVDIVDWEFVNDAHLLSPTEVIEKYDNKYPYFTRTELDFNDGYALIPSGYHEIYRKWYIDTFTKDNGDTREISVVKKLRDGNKRRKILYIAGLIMKKICPTVTFEHLLLNLIRERLYYYDNSDHVLTIKVLAEIAKNVINTPSDKINLTSKEKRKFVVDKKYCTDHGISPNTMKNQVKKKLKDEEIGNIYDFSLSIKENLIILNEMGVKIGKSRLYQWCKTYEVNTKSKRTNDLQKEWITQSSRLASVA